MLFIYLFIFLLYYNSYSFDQVQPPTEIRTLRFGLRFLIGPLGFKNYK